MGIRRCMLAAAFAAAAVGATSGAPAKRKRPYRLPGANVRQRVIWGSACRMPEGPGLAFGGQDQIGPDGRPHTRLLVDGAWKPIIDDLRKRNPFRTYHDQVRAVRTALKDARAVARRIYFEGMAADAEAKALAAAVAPAQGKALESLATLAALLASPPMGGEMTAYDAGQLAFAAAHLKAAQELAKSYAAPLTAEVIESNRLAQVQIELAAEALDAEPPARALSPVVHDARTGLYVLFGDDHCEYLTCDTWVFDPTKKRWFQRHPKTAPPPRANHTLETKDGVVTLTGGYRYANSIGYMGGQYIDIDDGPWTYDIEKDAWTGTGTAVAPDTRTYRTAPFTPLSYMQRGGKPDAAAFQARLEALPVNEWVATNPSHPLYMNRDWGTAVIDPDRDVILYWSGGHSSHGGSDVPHFHFATNRWELAYPVAFPLGQLYSNSSYPAGYNFNRRPWVTGHTYQNYGYDPPSKTIVFTGQMRDFFVYDPAVADWVGRKAKPKGMVYRSCFYSLTLTATPRGAVCWTAQGGLFLYDGAARTWTPLKTTGAKLPGASTDHSTLCYDSKRDRVLFVRKPYGRKHPYDGRVYACDLKTGAVTALKPEGAAGATRITGLDRGCYDAKNDLFLLATTVAGPTVAQAPSPAGAQPGAAGPRLRIPAYDCAGNRWVALDIRYKTTTRGRRTRRGFPHGHSSGIMYDPKRRLIWGCTTRGAVHVLRLDAAKADPKVLEPPPAPR